MNDSASPAKTIRVEGLVKSYGPVHAVRDISFDVEPGSLFAFLGKNGAGKSTTIGCLTTTLDHDSGVLQIEGHDVRRARDVVHRLIGVVFQDSVLDPELTVRENLTTRAGFYGLTAGVTQSRVEELTHLLALDAYVDRRYGKLSGGQKRRADIARALVHSPHVLFLDEPTAGLDPQSREQLWSAVATLREDQGVTVLLTTHYMEETERADQVCIIDEGKIIARGTPADLRAAHSSSILTVTTADPDAWAERCRDAGLEVQTQGRVVRVAVSSSRQALELLASSSDGVTDFEMRHGTMDDVFLKVTGQEAER